MSRGRAAWCPVLPFARGRRARRHVKPDCVDRMTDAFAHDARHRLHLDVVHRRFLRLGEAAVLEEHDSNGPIEPVYAHKPILNGHAEALTGCELLGFCPPGLSFLWAVHTIEADLDCLAIVHD